MGAALRDAPVLQYEYLVRAAHSGNALRNNDLCTGIGKLLKIFAQLLFGLQVDRRDVYKRQCGWSALPGSRKAGASGILCSAPFLKNEKTAGRARGKKPSGFPEGFFFAPLRALTQP